MFVVEATTPLKSNIAGDRRLRSISVARDNAIDRKTTYVRLRGQGLVRAAISRGDKTVKSSVPVQKKDVNGPLISSASSSSSSAVEFEVRAVVTIRKKMKEKLIEKWKIDGNFSLMGLAKGFRFASTVKNLTLLLNWERVWNLM